MGWNALCCVTATKRVLECVKTKSLYFEKMNNAYLGGNQVEEETCKDRTNQLSNPVEETG